MGAKCTSAAESQIFGQNARVRRVQFSRRKMAYNAPEQEVVWTVSSRQGVITEAPTDECTEIVLYKPSDLQASVLPPIQEQPNEQAQEQQIEQDAVPPSIVADNAPIRIALPPMKASNRDDLTTLLASAYLGFGGYTESETEGDTDWAKELLMKKKHKRRGFVHTLPETREGENSEWSSATKKSYGDVTRHLLSDTDLGDFDWYSKKNVTKHGFWNEQDLSSGPGSSSDEDKKSTNGRRVPHPTGTACDEDDFDWMPSKGALPSAKEESDWYPQKMKRMDGVSETEEEFYSSCAEDKTTRGQIEKVGEDTTYEFQRGGEDSVYESDWLPCKGTESDSWYTNGRQAEGVREQSDPEDTTTTLNGGETNDSKPTAGHSGSKNTAAGSPEDFDWYPSKEASASEKHSEEEAYTRLVQGLFFQLAAMGQAQAGKGKTTKGPSAPPAARTVPRGIRRQRTHVPRHVTRGSLQTPRPIMTPGFAPYSNPVPAQESKPKETTRGQSPEPKETTRGQSPEPKETRRGQSPEPEKTTAFHAGDGTDELMTAGAETKAKKVASEEELSQEILEELISEDLFDTYASTMTTPTGEETEEGKEEEVQVQSEAEGEAEVAVRHVDDAMEGDNLALPERVNYGVLTDGGQPEGEQDSDQESVMMLSISDNL